MDQTDDQQGILATITNKKRKRSSANVDAEIDLNPPKRKKLKTTNNTRKSAKKSSKRSSKKSSSKKSSSSLSSTTLKIIRKKDPVRFEQDLDDDDEENEIDISRNLKFKRLNNLISLSSILNIFDLNKKMKHIINMIETYGKRIGLDDEIAMDQLLKRTNKHPFISEAGFCILMSCFADKMEEEYNKMIQHFLLFRNYYRRHLFASNVKTSKNGRDYQNIVICKQCHLEDVESNFNDENPCDCQCILHLNCKECMDIDTASENDQDGKLYFCPFCVQSGLSYSELVQRREQNDKDGSFEVEKVVDYDQEEDEYWVKWKGYPNAANSPIELTSSCLEAVNEYWSSLDGKIPSKAQKGIQAITNNENDNHNPSKSVKADKDDTDIMMISNLEIADKNDEEPEDVEMKSNEIPEEVHENMDSDKNEKEEEEEKKFLPVKLHKIMDPQLIIRTQKYTKETFQKRKDLRQKYRRWLQKEVEKGSAIGQEVKHEMTRNENGDAVLPKYHLRSINRDWDCSLPRIRDIIKSFLARDWQNWTNDVSQKCFVIGDIIDPENPAKKYGSECGVHDNKAYGLFAVEEIKKDSLLFEYCGVIKPIGTASKKLDHLESELDQTTLFDLIGHLDAKRDKLYWGKRPNDQLVIDPSKHHNEGVYMNDYRDNVMDDPDDDDQVDDEEDEEEEQTKITNKNSNSSRKQNVKFYEVLVNNWPRVFAVAICDIKPGEELLGDYGVDFWSNFRLMMRRQSQLNEIKQKIHKEWQHKYDALKRQFEEQENEMEQLKKKLKAVEN